MLLYAITDRTQLQGSLLERIALLLGAGVDFLQIREKDLPPRDLFALAESVLALPNPHRTRILINERADVALAAGAHGVHLPANSILPGRIRAIAPSGFIIGISCHAASEVIRAEEQGVDFAVFGPVFDTSCKRRYGPPVGPQALEQAIIGRTIPVLALGGITLGNFRDCRTAAGIAAISLFQNTNDPVGLMKALREE